MEIKKSQDSCGPKHSKIQTPLSNYIQQVTRKLPLSALFKIEFQIILMETSMIKKSATFRIKPKTNPLMKSFEKSCHHFLCLGSCENKCTIFSTET